MSTLFAFIRSFWTQVQGIVVGFLVFSSPRNEAKGHQMCHLTVSLWLSLIGFIYFLTSLPPFNLLSLYSKYPTLHWTLDMWPISSLACLASLFCSLIGCLSPFYHCWYSFTKPKLKPLLSFVFQPHDYESSIGMCDCSASQRYCTLKLSSKASQNNSLVATMLVVW